MAGCSEGPSSPSTSADVQPSVTRVVVTGPGEVPLGKNAQFRAFARLADGQQIDVTQTAVWQTSQWEIGTVSDGLAVGKSPHT
jgi:hypothetical protein